MLGLCACSAPGLEVATDEPDVAVYVDGQRAGVGAVALPYRYYGTATVTVVPPRRAVREDVRMPVRAEVVTAPPAPMWLFPFDFFAELYVRGFASAEPVRAKLDLPAAQVSLVAGSSPPVAADLRQRVAAFEQER